MNFKKMYQKQGSKGICPESQFFPRGCADKHLCLLKARSEVLYSGNLASMFININFLAPIKRASKGREK